MDPRIYYVNNKEFNENILEKHLHVTGFRGHLYIGTLYKNKYCIDDQSNLHNKFMPKHQKHN